MANDSNEQKEIEEKKALFVAHVRQLQDQITDTMKKFDPELEITEDIWTRLDANGQDGGGGRTRAFKGAVFETAGVNTSSVFGAVDPKFAKKIGGDGGTFWAAGISLIIHPINPKVPTVHANFRMIQAGEKIWYGGGADLTPYYPHLEDFRHFHQTWSDACKPYGTYQKWKETCDTYFTNTHRDNEMRGIGGIFFDHLNSGDREKDYAMVKDLSTHFIKSYFPIVEKRQSEAFTPEDEDFQLHRHGRYVEFNILHDRGTKFGLESNGRTDSILISLPHRAKFSYRYAPKENSPHAEMMGYFKPCDWI
ncbi:MAG: oxygen-dependent coproporphyrinogen oxidase [Halobacteriovoraceae bacterium]|mgnify:CR=1 FL=1|jgi:coproporphyrinogen III oxidase|nr:oxygen-dependent coproporphyrinogen oxidase [Halobacteriovoraceae bacterium]MBT5094883.1 oxygen-dependent coproporphyrinogen oxidase [Halobacteriovoraceae bacterium]